MKTIKAFEFFSTLGVSWHEAEAGYTLHYSASIGEYMIFSPLPDREPSSCERARMISRVRALVTAFVFESIGEEAEFKKVQASRYKTLNQVTAKDFPTVMP